MVIKRCDMCFQDKPALVPVTSGCPAMVCKACSYKISQVSGFLEYHGVKLQYTLPEPEETTTSKKTGEKKES